MAKFELYNVAKQMLQPAKKRFADNPQQFNYVVDDYKNVKGSERFDPVISSLSIHHLPHEQKRRLFD